MIEIILIAAVLGAVVFLGAKYRPVISWLRRQLGPAAKLAERLYNDRLLSAHYKQMIETAADEVAVIDDLWKPGLTLDQHRELIVAASISYYRRVFDDPGKDEAFYRKLAAAMTEIMRHSDDLVYNFVYFSHKNFYGIEVKKLTLILIDVFGQLFDLKDKLDAQYFKHLIYGLNQCLVSLRINGTNDKSVKRMGAVLFRLYKLTKAYHSLKSDQFLSEKEFYEKAARILGTFGNTYSGK